MCFASAESDSWSDFQGVHVCSLILSHMSQWKWDFFQNSSQHFNRSFHFFSMCKGGGYSKITMDTKSVSECGGYIWSCDQVVSHFFLFLFILNANYFLLMFENHMFKLWSLFLVISTRCSLLLFFCKGCVSIWIWGWSPCVHMLMLPPHLPGLVCIFCFRFSGERESFLSPPRFLLRSRKRKQNGLRNHSWETRARFYWINFGWSEVIDFTLTESRFWGLPLKAPWIPRILSQSWGDIDHRMLLWMLTAVKVYGGLKLPKSKVDE